MDPGKAHETYSLFGLVTSLLLDVVAHGMYSATLVPSINGRKHTKSTLSLRLTDIPPPDRVAHATYLSGSCPLHYQPKAHEMYSLPV